VTGGKKILELRPDVDWDKGRALAWVIESVGVDESPLALYVGDDVTDEDAFRAIRSTGVGVVVADADGEDRPTAAHLRLSGTDEVGAFLDRIDALVVGHG
jgi:trehalose-phosphatase